MDDLGYPGTHGYEETSSSKLNMNQHGSYRKMLLTGKSALDGRFLWAKLGGQSILEILWRPRRVGPCGVPGPWKSKGKFRKLS